MKKYTVYLMGLLAFAVILSCNLQVAAAPESAVEYEEKELAAAMADPKKVAELYTKLTQQVLYEQYKVRQCRINRTCSQKMAEAQESVWDILYGDEDVHEKALDFRRIESHGETTIKSIAILSEEVKNLKQRFAQENKGSWWGWLTTKKQVLAQNVSNADINNLIKERNTLKREYDTCDKARNKSIRKIEKYNTLFAEKISQKVTNPQQLLQQQKMLRYLKDLISKIDQMNKLMLEKDKLEWQLRLLAFTRGRAALQEEERVQQTLEKKRLEEEKKRQAQNRMAVQKRAEIGSRAGSSEEPEEKISVAERRRLREEEGRREAQERRAVAQQTESRWRPIIKRPVAVRFAGYESGIKEQHAEPEEGEEKVYVSREQERRLQEQQRHEEQRQRVGAAQAQEQAYEWGAGPLPREMRSQIKVETKELEADRKRMADMYQVLVKEVSGLEDEIGRCNIDIKSTQEIVKAQDFFFNTLYGKEPTLRVGEWQKQHADRVKKDIVTLNQEIKQLKQRIAQKRFAGKKQAVAERVNVPHIGNLTKQKKKLEEEYQTCSAQLPKLVSKATKYQQMFDQKELVRPDARVRWHLKIFGEFVFDINQMTALMLEKHELEREWGELLTTY